MVLEAHAPVALFACLILCFRVLFRSSGMNGVKGQLHVTCLRDEQGRQSKDSIRSHCL